MFNPVKAASGLVSVIVQGAKLTAKAQAMAKKAVEDTDGDGIPQYKEMLNILIAIKDKLPSTASVIKGEFAFYASNLAELVKLGAVLFAHVVDAEQPKSEPVDNQ